MIVLVEVRYTDCTNKRYSLFEKTYIYEDFNGCYMCVLIVRVQNCECMIFFIISSELVKILLRANNSVITQQLVKELGEFLTKKREIKRFVNKNQ